MTTRGPAIRRLIQLFSAAGVAAAFALIAVASSAGVRNGAFMPASPGEPISGAGRAVQSTNWSGYVVQSKKHHITAVKSKFKVPSGGVPTGYASNWTGIGGFGTSDLIQAGSSEFFTTRAKYFAWYEMLPGPETPLQNCKGKPSCKVRPGDQMMVKIKQVSSNKWQFAIKDATEGWSWSKTVKYSSQRATAEWILEAPTVSGRQSKLPHGLGISYFGPTSTYTTTNGKTHTIAQGNPLTIDLVHRGKAEATPSPLASDGQSFNSCAYASSCSTP
jgi:hypothetical protein